MKEKFISALLLLALLPGLLSGCSTQTSKPTEDATPSGTAVEPIEMKIGIGYHLGCALFFVAQEAGYFEDYGLDVELVPFDSTATALTAMRNGELDCADFGSTGAFSMIA